MSANQSTPVERLYAVAQSGGIAGFDLHDDGSMTELPGSPWPTGAGTFCVRVSPDGRFLYVAPGLGLGTPVSIRNLRNPELLTYSIADDGSLSRIDQLDLARTPVAMTLSADGRNLYLGMGNGPAGFFRGGVAHFRIGDDGKPAANGDLHSLGKFLDGAPQPYLAPDGKHLYVASVFAKSVVWFDVTADGSLQGPVGRVKSSGIFPITPVFSLDGRFLYVPNEQSKSISAFAVGADGGLTEMADSPIPTGKFPHNPVASRDGKYVYFANTMSHQIDGFEIGADGGLTRVPGSPFATEPGPAMLEVSTDGKWLYLLSSPVFKDGSKVVVTAFGIQGDGGLKDAGHGPVPTGLGFADGPSLAVVPIRR